MARWSGKKKGRERTGTRVFGRTTGRAEWTPGQKRLARFLGGLVLLAALVGGGRELVRFCFLRSNLFRIRQIDIQTGDTLTPELVREYLKIREGMPLFALDIDRCRADFLRHAPVVRQLTIRRRLPDRIEVRIVEREPLARFARKPLVVDAEGWVFPRRVGIDLLPTLSGYDGLGIEPGVRLKGMALAAVELLESVRVENVVLAVVDVHVGHEDYVACTMADQRYAKIAWEDMGARSERSLARLRIQLLGLAKSMNSERGRTSGRWDATVAGRAYAQ